MEPRFLVVAAIDLAPGIAQLTVTAPRVARHGTAGQFVIVRPRPESERIPLTISRADPASGTIDLIVQDVGRTSHELATLTTGRHLADVLGPLGRPTETGPYGTCVVVAGGVGAAIALPVAVAYRTAGNSVVSVLGARTKRSLILHREFGDVCDATIVLTEDGSAGVPGLVTDGLSAVIDRGGVDRVFVVGPIAMMRAVAALTKPPAIPTIASLNPIMVDGTGMCGGCRVRIGDTTRFACVDGPEFDAHLVDFDSLERRNQAYRTFELCQLESVSTDG